MSDRYGPDVLSGDWRARGRPQIRTVDAVAGLVVERAPDEANSDGFVGAIVGVEKQLVTLEGRGGRRRVFPLGGGYLIDGEAVVLAAPPTAPAGPARTASGSRVAPQQRAQVARASRIFVEGRHDAELVEKVWGADLRAEGVVVEYLEGVDHLPAVLAAEPPTSERRIGVLVDHLVAGSKESRVAAQVAGANVLVVGHPYIDVWQAVKPERLGLRAWPDIPRGTEWKHGICAHLGWPHDDQADIARAWQRILGSVRTYTDLEPALLARVEQLIDFVAG
ncbi:MAG: DUF3097 domain-containing protein [Pseudolysinimonas sp.]